MAQPPPATMRAIAIRDGGWRFEEVPVPVPGPDQVLVRTHAAALNRADLLVLDGSYTVNPALAAREQPIAGMDGMGEVAAVGKRVPTTSVGDRVMYMATSAFADFIAIDHRLLMPVPLTLSAVQAAATPSAAITEYDALIVQGGLREGQHVLVLGAATGVGVLATQIAHYAGAATVIGSSTDPVKRTRLDRYGVHVAIDTRRPDWAATVLDATGGHGADLVIDHLGGNALVQALSATAVGGTIVHLGHLAGRHAEIDLDQLGRRRVRLIGSTFRTRTREELFAIAAETASALRPALTEGAIAPAVDRVFPFSQAEYAAAYLTSGQAFGKVVLDFA
ncbi:NADPH2:quinone reductase [Murinocardiopsis flavida]|uniref:NADPH2:quinone reductase n=1 Tax=Murinocardiopsis flavida TaxID=645275 RepID=A0A2P8DNT2_9ACTN|nr:zinc-binding dehydrogenase [Murinocardiopsis flavida]PSK98868.1 NADPH2:quinone reductase [Murinocardiopsis flavida]